MLRKTQLRNAILAFILLSAPTVAFAQPQISLATGYITEGRYHITGPMLDEDLNSLGAIGWSIESKLEVTRSFIAGGGLELQSPRRFQGDPYAWYALLPVYFLGGYRLYRHQKPFLDILGHLGGEILFSDYPRNKHLRSDSAYGLYIAFGGQYHLSEHVGIELLCRYHRLHAKALASYDPQTRSSRDYKWDTYSIRQTNLVLRLAYAF